MFFSILFFSLITFSKLSAQIPGKEMRAAWLTTVWGLDWPGTKVPAGGGEFYINQQKQQFTRILDSLKIAGMNAVFFQVRPECDAFYPSSYEPWSAHLAASRGTDPGYDPLLFAIEESHKRGLELHAWLNPYRFESVAGKYAGQPGDYNQTNPEWVLSYSGGGAILDPGNPGVRKRITDIVEEIVTKYDVDGIVFDDYFYAYGGTPASLDNYSQTRWKPAGMDLHDWRRDNVNRMVSEVYYSIKKHKPWVTFGVSPFGIWTVDPQVAAKYGLTLPSGITGMDAYKTIYCDPVAWLAEGTVDYISPQIYWPTTSSGQNYKVLSTWWSDVVSQFGRHLYVSHTLSSLDPSDYQPPLALKAAGFSADSLYISGMSLLESSFSKYWKYSITGLDPSEFGLQILWNRISDRNQSPGSVFFRATMFFIKGFMNYLRTNEYKNLALPPAKNWYPVTNRTLPANLRMEEKTFHWDSGEENVRFAVYGMPRDLYVPAELFSNGRHLLGMAYGKSFEIPARISSSDNYYLAVSVLDRYGNEYPPVIMGVAPGENKAARLVTPATGMQVFPGFTFKWTTVGQAAGYILEVAEDSDFQHLKARKMVADTTITSGFMTLKEDSVYFWRVSTRMPGTEDAISETGSFIFRSLPKPVVTYPQNEAVAVSVTPRIQWKPLDDEFRFRMQISSNVQFTDIVSDIWNISGTEYQIPPGTVFSYSTYFLRMQGVSTDSVTIWSDIVKFSTVRTPPPVPEILSPAEGTTVAGPVTTVSVRSNPLARSTTFQVSSSSSFPWNNRMQQSVELPDTILTLNNLQEGNWYIRARANYSSSLYTDWSQTVSFRQLTTSYSDFDLINFEVFSSTRISEDVHRISYSLPDRDIVRIYVSDLTGRRIDVDGPVAKSRGNHTVMIPSAVFSRGFYLLTVETTSHKKTIKLIK